jgi:hypothetical protein
LFRHHSISDVISLAFKSASLQGGEINQALYAHMNNKRKMKKKKKSASLRATATVTWPKTLL